MMEIFRQMVNQCIRIGLENECCTLKRLSQLAYQQLSEFDVLSSYKINAISQACGRLSMMKQSAKRDIKTKSPYVRKPYITNCYGFKINGMLFTIPYKRGKPINILLNNYTTRILSDHSITVRSFTISGNNTLSISYSKAVTPIDCKKTLGIDRNLRNITVGNQQGVIFYKTGKLLSIKENSMFVKSSFRRNDARIRKKIAQKIGSRQKNRVRQLLHKISKDVVKNAKESKSMIVFENIKGIRRLYRKGNGQGRKYRRKLNSWSFYELQRQIQYKAVWEGIPVKFIDPRRTSKLCPKCGKRIQEDRQNRRKVWCNNCIIQMDRDVVASMNIAYKGWTRFIHPRDDTNEAMVQEPDFTKLAILKVDVSKSSHQLKT